MSRVFVGREPQLERLRRALADLKTPEAIWITGPAGIGKSRLVAEALGRTEAIQLDGYFMSTLTEGLPYLGELLGSSPATTQRSHLSRWLSAVVGTRSAAALVIDDFHLVDRTLAQLLLRVSKNTPLALPLLLVGRDDWYDQAMMGGRVCHLPLWELEASEVARFAAAYGRDLAELPSATMGHPLLMDLFFRDGLSTIEAWVDRLLGELSPHGRLIMRLAIAQSPLQLRWAMRGHDEAQLELLKRQGIFHPRRLLFRPVREGILRLMQESGEDAELECELLEFLQSRAVLDERDLARALRLSERHQRHRELASLLERYATAPPSRPALVQPALLAVLGNPHVPARVKLGSYRALTEYITLSTPAQLLAAHDLAIDKPDVAERRLAQISFLRAAFVSGRRELPNKADSYLREVLACAELSPGVKAEVLHLWAFRTIHAARDDEELMRALPIFEQNGFERSLLQAYRVLFEAVGLTKRFCMADAILLLQRSAEAFAGCGLQPHVEWVRRYLMVLYYMTGQTSAFHDTLARIEVTFPDSYHAEFWYRFFKTVDAWNRGAPAALEAEIADLPAQVARHPHPLLPGPYFSDYLPWCFRVIADRAAAAPVDAALVELFVNGLSELVLFAPILITSVCLAQHAWLVERRQLPRLKLALAATGPIGAMHALLLSRFEELAAGPSDLEMSLDLVDRALTLSEPLTAPYYVVMAARLVHDQGLSVAPFVARLRSHPRIAELPAGSRRITEAAALALGGQPGPASCPLDVRDAVAALVGGRVPGDAVDPDVHALKTLIDEQWFEKLQLDEFAGAHGISRFALSRRFKRALGRSPRRYQQECRLGQAKRKLVETSWTITDIAYECGFVDAAQFSRLFKEATGVTPGQYRDLQT